MEHIIPAGTTSFTDTIMLRNNSGVPQTGIVFNTAGMICRYVRPGETPVAITLVNQTVTGAWVSGGFKEIDSVNTPGLYRIDIPDAAFVAGKTQVTLTVHGFAASAVNAYDYQLGNVVNETIYTAPYLLVSDQTNLDEKLDVFKGSALTVNLQMVDANGKAVSIGGATLSVKVYDLSNTLITSYTPTIQFNANGQVSFVLDSTTTNTAGTYNIYITRTNGATDVVSFGPLQLLVKSL
jgi:hypothetical protein